MSEIEEAKKIAETILGKLGFQAEITPHAGENVLELDSAHNKLLIGKNGERLDDLQYLVNRIMRKTYPDSDRVRLDCEDFRAQKETQIMDKARHFAEKVKDSGEELWMHAMNSYERRLVHNALVDDDEVESISEDSTKRIKKILLRLKE